MSERPILFSGEMVRAILDGRKTQTRRIVKPQPTNPRPTCDEHIWSDTNDPITRYFSCKHGEPGDRLWVKETHRHPSKENPRVRVEYRADMSSWGICDSHNVATNEVTVDAKLFPGKANEYSKQHWRPSIFMPRWASRIDLEIVAVRVERLNDISEADAKAEGAPEPTGKLGCYPSPSATCVLGPLDYRQSYRKLWNSINGPGSWAENPWVWVLEFRMTL